MATMAIGGAVGSGIAGSVLFVTAGGTLAQDNAGFYYDDVDHQLLINAGTAAKPSLIFGDDTTGFYRPAVDQVAIAIGGVQAFNFGATGPDSDRIFATGRCLIDSRTTDRVLLSHRDMSAVANFALSQSAAGGTVVSSATGVNVYAGVNASGKWAVNGTSFEWWPAIDNSQDIGQTALRVRRSFVAEYSEVTEMTAPAVAPADKVRFFAKDNGSGKTQLMAQFGTGAAVQVAIEP